MMYIHVYAKRSKENEIVQDSGKNMLHTYVYIRVDKGHQLSEDFNCSNSNLLATVLNSRKTKLKEQNLSFYLQNTTNSFRFIFKSKLSFYNKNRVPLCFFMTREIKTKNFCFRRCPIGD